MNLQKSTPISNQSSDKRFFPRWEVSNKVLCRINGQQQSLQALSQDISCSGIRIETYEHMYPAQNIKLIIFLNEIENIALNGKVVWVEQNPSKRVVGIIFDDIDIEKQEKVLQHAFEVKKDEVMNHWYQGWDGDQ